MEVPSSSPMKTSRTFNVQFFFIYLGEYKIRDEKLNPILKKTLFEMMNKEPANRLELVETRRRLSLLKYTTTESINTLAVSKQDIENQQRNDR
jgi:hypothetical protein